MSSTPSGIFLPSMAGPGDGGGWDLFQQLLRKRIVFLGDAIDDKLAGVVGAQLLLLAEDSDKDIAVYINSPGGSVTAGLAIYDTMQYVPCDVPPVCMGPAASVGPFPLRARAPRH